jgi:hypothetical protein
MKTPLLLTALASVCIASTLWAASLASIHWTDTHYSFGQIKKGNPVTATFTFTNSGQTPLIISTARGSCGCTGVEFPKEPIYPGKSGNIEATFDAGALGTFNKTVTVESNASEPITVLHLSGEVVK